MTPLLSDARLARQATGGDERAFAAIYRRYHQDLYRFCLSILGRSEDAQEALQNTMVKALRSLPGEQREIQLKPWLYRVAHNESIDLLRKRRDGPELDAGQAGGAMEIAEAVALRERLGRLLADLGELPERQRSALVMRELGGLGYEQIGEAFETSVSVARQTVYEARLNLRELEAGREMSCDRVTQQLSEADGRITRRRDIQAHLRACPECRTFRDSIDTRRHDLAALSPLPAALGVSILHGLAGGQAATSVGAGTAAAGAGTGVGKVAAASVTLKVVATVAVVATVGVTAADRGGLIDAGLPGERGNDSIGLEKKEVRGTGSDGTVPASPSTGSNAAHHAGLGGDSGASTGSGEALPAAGAGERSVESGSNPPNSADGDPKSPPGPPASLPDASRHGQETAAAHKANGSSKPGHSGRGSSGSHRGSRSHSGPPEHAQKGGKDSAKDQPSKAPPPVSSETDSQSAQPEAQPGGDTAAETGATNGQKPEASP
jgi:RNA polymerase sigma factor (sigma-70 family)